MDSSEAPIAADKPAPAPLKVTQELQAKDRCYPAVGSHVWNAWPILAIETGGYADFEVHDAWTGRRAHCYAYKCPMHQADPFSNQHCRDCRSTTIYDALRRLVDAMEAAQFFGEDLDEALTPDEIRDSEDTRI